jgi:hypothetical protein
MTFDDKLGDYLPGIIEALESFDYERTFEGVESLPAVRASVQEFFRLDRGLPLPWEELAALAIAALVKGL